MDMIAQIFLHRWSNGGLSGRYSGHNNHHQPPNEGSSFKGFIGFGGRGGFVFNF